MAAFMSESIVHFAIGSLFGALAVVALSLPVILPVINRGARRLEARSASQLVELGRGDAIKGLKTDLAALSDRLRATEEELKVKTTAAREAECGLSDKESELAKLRSALGERVALVDLQKTELVAAGMQVEALKGRLAQMGEEAKAAEEWRHGAERALSDKEMEMAKLTSAFGERSLLADTQKLEIMVLRTQVQALQERLIQCGEEAKALEALREAAECALSERDSKLVTTMRALDERSALADSQKGEIATLMMQIQTLQGRVTESDEEINTVESRRVAALRSLSEREAELARATIAFNELHQLTALVEQLTAQRTADEILHRRAREDLESRLIVQSRLLNESESEIMDLRDEVESACKAENDLRIAIIEIEGRGNAAAENFIAEKARLEAALDRANGERARLVHELAGLERRQGEETRPADPVDGATLGKRVTNVAA
jgi:chromosome segregation ATPase